MSAYSEMFSNTWALAMVLLFFGGSIFVHELGHFLAAKWRGLKVLRFSIGFGPRLFSWTGADGCKYMLSLLPLGGYVALPQLADMGALEGGEREDASAKKLPPISAWDKIIVSAAGAFFNVLFAAALAAAVWAIGLPSSPYDESGTIGYVPEYLTDASGAKIPSPARAAGLRAGDKILSIDGAKVEKFSDVIEKIALGSGRGADGAPTAQMRIERGGKAIDVQLKPVLVSTNVRTSDAIRMIGVAPAQHMTVGAVMKNSPAERGGLKPGDEVVSINGVALHSQQQLADFLDEHGEDKAVDFKVLRGAKPIVLKLKPEKITLTKPLCEIAIGGGGTLSLITSGGADGQPERVKTLSGKIDNPYFDQIRAGDVLYAADGKRISNVTQLNALINHVGGREKIKLSFMSPDMRLKDVFLPRQSSSKILPPKERVMLGYSIIAKKSVSHPSIPEQFADALERTWSALYSLANPKSDVGISSLAGPVDIGRVIYQLSLQDISLVLSFAVLLNINLAILNLLPIPVLDGGHIIFAAIAGISGRKIPPTVVAAIQGIFSVLFVSLMVYVVCIGFMRWSGDARMEESSGMLSEYYIKNITFKNNE